MNFRIEHIYFEIEVSTNTNNITHVNWTLWNNQTHRGIRDYFDTGLLGDHVAEAFCRRLTECVASGIRIRHFNVNGNNI